MTLHDEWLAKQKVDAEEGEKRVAAQLESQKKDFEAMQTHPLLKELSDVGITMVPLSYNAMHLYYKLEGKIRWVNQDGSISIIEEQGQTNNLDGIIELIHYYIENADKYTDFVKDEEE